MKNKISDVIESKTLRNELISKGREQTKKYSWKKMAEETQRKELAMKHPSVADALDALQRAEEQVRIVAALVQE